MIHVFKYMSFHSYKTYIMYTLNSHVACSINCHFHQLQYSYSIHASHSTKHTILIITFLSNTNQTHLKIISCIPTPNHLKNNNIQLLYFSKSIIPAIHTSPEGLYSASYRLILFLHPLTSSPKHACTIYNPST